MACPIKRRRNVMLYFTPNEQIALDLYYGSAAEVFMVFLAPLGKY
jgi:hypothetical protein